MAWPSNHGFRVKRLSLLQQQPSMWIFSSFSTTPVSRLSYLAAISLMYPIKLNVITVIIDVTQSFVNCFEGMCHTLARNARVCVYLEV